jgi:hypothetical protein
MTKVILLMLASACASAAIVADGITYKPFIRGMERHGEATVTAEFIGMRWPDGDETAFAGFAIEDGTVRPVTGP